MTDYIPQATDRDVYITRSFDAPIEVVWKFWTEPDLLAQWFGPHGISVPVDTVEVEAREGGPWNLTMKDENGEYPVRSTFKKVVKHEYLELEMHTDENAGFLGNEILRIQFHDHGERTRITLHQGPFTPELRDVTTDGWNDSFVKLDTILEAAAS
jgi:uncharacterized protein YndB with AHSA1/START domain